MINALYGKTNGLFASTIVFSYDFTNFKTGLLPGEFSVSKYAVSRRCFGTSRSRLGLEKIW